ncbi:hypothetical protein BJ166DRAFT_186572 [Pestalotiopsis sp. NC0098]|nr:hypothetical protein BJ166DRAFT_186572 [Pestalotiopsis sp. NC0098]
MTSRRGDPQGLSMRFYIPRVYIFSLKRGETKPSQVEQAHIQTKRQTVPSMESRIPYSGASDSPRHHGERLQLAVVLGRSPTSRFRCVRTTKETRQIDPRSASSRTMQCGWSRSVSSTLPPLILSPPAPLDYLELWIDFCSAQAASPSIASRGVFGSKTRPLVPPGEAGEMKTVWGSPGWVVRVHHRLRKLLTYFRLETTEMCGFKAAIVGVTMAKGGLRSWVCGCGGRAILTIRAPNRTDRRAL